MPEDHACSCIPAGIFREIVVSRKGAYSCPVASGVIFAVNVDMRGDAGAPLGAYSQALLASMQARQPIWSLQIASTVWHGEACVQCGGHCQMPYVTFATK